MFPEITLSLNLTIENEACLGLVGLDLDVYMASKIVRTEIQIC